MPLLKTWKEKYTWREAYKNKDEDLQKARWYLNRLLSELGSGP